jgi:ankyrin repeat protein
LPESVRNEVIRQLQYIADSPGEIQSRRLLACFEHALMTLCYDDASRTDPELIPTALNYMLHAAASGHQPAQSLVGRLFGVFGHELPIGRDTETKWLFQASLRGSLTAMKRLQMLNPAVHQQADRLIRFKHNGSFVEGEVWKDTEYLLFLISAGLADVPPGFVHNLAAHGQLESLRRLSHLPHQTFNTQNGLGETPLVAACRCGHANIVQLLLTLGADPSIGTFGNVHPLHFLSAFPDEDIPQISDLLLRHGAELEIYSQRGSVYKQGIDGRFGVDEGTPLLWSVITGNVVAIQELLRHGANIFSYIHLHEWEMTSEVVIHCSPLESAIAMYRYNIVNLLLSSCTNREELLRGLNDLRLVGQRVRATPLLMALEKQTVSRLSPMLLHGHLRHHAQLRTVEMLLHYGSDPLRLSQEQSGESIHAIEVVCQDDNLLLLDFLWNYDGARLRPPPRLYFKCVSLAIRRSKRTIFDFLLSHQHDIAQVTETRKLKLELLEKTCSLSTDTHYVSSVVHSIVHGLPLAPSAATIKPDFTQPLLIALMAGNTEASRLLCQYGHCNLTKGPDNLSMLASVIVLDATSPIVKDRVDHLLHLVSSFFPPALKRKLFWKCASYNAHGRRGQLTAFQFVFARREIAHDTTIIPATANSEIWRNLLRAFNEPDFLNAQVDPRSPDFPGDTALHMAARAGCMKEISDMLAGQYGGSFELSLVNRHNETVLDVCIAHHEILVNEVEDRLMHLGTLSTEGALLKKIRDLQAAVGTLIERGCGISTFCLLALKKSEKIFLIVRRPNILMHVPYKPGKAPRLFLTFKSHCGRAAKTSGDRVHIWKAFFIC